MIPLKLKIQFPNEENIKKVSSKCSGKLNCWYNGNRSRAKISFIIIPGDWNCIKNGQKQGNVIIYKSIRYTYA